MTKRELRVGDVYLEPDGWGQVLVGADTSGVGDNRIVTWCYLKKTSLTNSHVYQPLSKVKVPDNWVFMFNLGDVFHDATKKE